MIQFHPDDNTLSEYAAGAIDTAVGIGIKTHLDFCPVCRNKVSEFKQLGAMYFDQQPQFISKENASASFEALMSKIKQYDSRPATHTLAESTSATANPTTNPTVNDRLIDLPPIVQKLLSNQNKLRWQFVSTSLKQARLVTGQNKYEVCLHKIRRGGKVAEHDHRGLEVTVVLEGAFSDENGRYHKGDFLLREPGDTHRPTATQDQDCLCLSIVAAPVKLTGWLGKVINPFLKVSPA